MPTATTTLRVPSNLVVEGDMTVTGVMPTYPRTSLQQDDLVKFNLPLTQFRVWDAFQTALGTAGADDLGVGTGAFGTGLPYITGGDMKALGATTRRARIVAQLPAEYVSGQTVRVSLYAGMLTTVADTSCTVDVELYESNLDTTKTGSDLVTTAATTMNSLTFAAKAFDVTSTTLGPGDFLDIRISIACNDAATGTAVTPAIAHAELVLDIKG